MTSVLETVIGNLSEKIYRNEERIQKLETINELKRPAKKPIDELSKELESMANYRNLYRYLGDEDDLDRFYYVTGISAGAGKLRGKFIFTYIRVHIYDSVEKICCGTPPLVPFVKEKEDFLSKMELIEEQWTVRINF